MRSLVAVIAIIMLVIFVLILAIKADERVAHGIVGHVNAKRLAIIASRAKVNAGKNTGILDLVKRCGEIRKVPKHPRHRLSSRSSEVTRSD